MSLSLISNATAIATNLTLPFQGIGGTAPYVYSVLPGGAGGTIDPSTGLYTSPSTSGGTDEIVVTDATSATAELSISVLNPIELVCEIIQTAMGLDVGQVYLYNQKLFMPPDSAIYVAVGVQSCKSFGRTTEFDGENNQSIQSLNMQAILSIDIYSRSLQALNRKEEVLLALSSQYAESQMELNSFAVAPLTTNFINLSEIDGAAIPYRFNLSVSLQYFVTVKSNVPFFDSFQTPSITTNS